MKKSKQWVLNRLDQWYLQRFERGFTPELASQHRNSLVEIVEGENFPPEEKKPILQAFSIEQIRAIVGQTFSAFYHTFENTQSYDSLPKGIREEYVEPMLKEFRKMHLFVGEVRKTADEKFPEDLSDADIEESFKKAYGNWRGYADFMKSVMNASNMTIELLHMQKKLSDKEYNLALKIMNYNQEFAYTLTERIFGDLS